MISQRFRFHGHNSLNFVYKHGRTVRSPALSLKYILNDRRQTCRAAVVVSKKIHKSAVTRNRIRRRLYELLRLQQPSIEKSYDLVITILSERAAALDSNELNQILMSLLNQAGVLEKPSSKNMAKEAKPSV